uniref:transposase n=1 Tax=Deinococcus aquatilis TaxID=519440 RepID=UPI00036FACBC
DTATRERLVARLLRHLPARRWKVLIADREFVGQDWSRFLQRRRIKRCLRVKGNARVDGDRLDEVYADLAPGQMVAMMDKEVIYGCRMQMVVTRSPAGDLVCLATDLHAQEAGVVYRLRWSVECTFSSMKLRGFDLERTAMTQQDRLERLFGMVTLAWVWCLLVGVDGVLQRPIQLKTHGRKALSLVTAGWERLAHALRWSRRAQVTFTKLLTTGFSAPDAAGDQDVQY